MLAMYVWTVRDSWSWMRYDLPLRALPMLLVPVAWATWGSQGLGWLAAILPGSAQAAQWVALGALHGGVVLAGCLAFRVRWWKVRAIPTPGALVFDTAYYALINAPIEELFFRGWLQPLAGQALGNAWMGMGAVALLFGLYHRLGRWSWPLAALTTIGGFYFGSLQLLYGAILVPIVAHAFATTALLSCGPWLLQRVCPRWACEVSTEPSTASG